MTCARCNQPIREGERYVQMEHQSPTGPQATTVYVHEERCQPAPRQRYPKRRCHW